MYTLPKIIENCSLLFRFMLATQIDAGGSATDARTPIKRVMQMDVGRSSTGTLSTTIDYSFVTSGAVFSDRQ
jgi:hypothetical protein